MMMPQDGDEFISPSEPSSSPGEDAESPSISSTGMDRRRGRSVSELWVSIFPKQKTMKTWEQRSYESSSPNQMDPNGCFTLFLCLRTGTSLKSNFPGFCSQFFGAFFEEQNGDVKNGEDVTGQCGRDDRVHQVARLSSKGVSQRVTKCQLFKACFVAVLDD